MTSAEDVKKVKKSSKASKAKAIAAKPAKKPSFIEKARLALQAIFDYEAKVKTDDNQLLDNDHKRTLTMVFSFTRCKAEPDRKPTLIPVPHSTYDMQSSECCLITPSPQRFWKDKVSEEADKLPMIAKVIEFGKLMKRYNQKEDRMKLAKEFDCFLVHSSVVAIVVPFLGQAFRAKRDKMPRRVAFDRELKEDSTHPISHNIISAMSSARIVFTSGINTPVRIGCFSQSVSDLAENAEAVYNFMRDHVDQVLNKDLRPGEEKWAIRQVDLVLAQGLHVPLVQNLIEA